MSAATAALSGTFVVNGSPTKTQILDEQKGRTQLANLTMSAVVLLVVVFFTTVLTDMPTSVQGIILDAHSADDIDDSAGVSMGGLMDYLRARQVTFALSGADTALVDTLRACNLLDRIGADHLHDTLAEALAAFRRGGTPRL